LQSNFLIEGRGFIFLLVLYGSHEFMFDTRHYV